jgi:hypothetical protein
MPTPSPMAIQEPSPVIPGTTATPRALFPNATIDTDSNASPQVPAIPPSPPDNQGPNRATVQEARNSMAAGRSRQRASQHGGSNNTDTSNEPVFHHVQIVDNWGIGINVHCIGTGPHVHALRDLCYIGDSFGTGIIARKPDADEVAVTVEVHVDKRQEY